MSVKFQITLPDDLALALKRAAVKDKVPLAQYIRVTMVERLGRVANAASGDPFASITDLADAPDVDLAASVDEILYK
ncbi:MAG: hypothetical protein ACLP59_05200 [Bryobacteraceae bacterium]